VLTIRQGTGARFGQSVALAKDSIVSASAPSARDRPGVPGHGWRDVVPRVLGHRPAWLSDKPIAESGALAA
jgi:hypothetical protein